MYAAPIPGNIATEARYNAELGREVLPREKIALRGHIRLDVLHAFNKHDVDRTVASHAKQAGKMEKPEYQPIATEHIPRVPAAGGGHVRVIAGDHGGVRGPARTSTPITMLDAELSAGATLPVVIPSTWNALAVVAKGRVRAGANSATAGELILFANDAPLLELVAEEDSHVIVLSGEPLGEPIVQYGPFVMNTAEEIEQAIYDVNNGKLGPIRLVKALLAQRKIKNFRIADFAIDPAEQRKFLGLSVAQLVISNAGITSSAEKRVVKRRAAPMMSSRVIVNA